MGRASAYENKEYENKGTAFFSFNFQSLFTVAVSNL